MQGLRFEGWRADSMVCHRQMNAHLWVNIFDVLQAAKTGIPPRRFDSLRQLAVYSKRKKRVFPKDEAKGGALKFLLKRILHVPVRRLDGGVDLAEAVAGLKI